VPTPADLGDVAAAGLVDGESVKISGRILESGRFLAVGTKVVPLSPCQLEPLAWVELSGLWDAATGTLRVTGHRPLRPAPGCEGVPALPEMAAARDPSRLCAIVQRAALARALRQELESEGYVEATTPMVQASAEMCAVDQVAIGPIRGRTYYLRTDPEEYLKRYLAAGLGGVYEISTNVRLDPADARHLVEFQSCEFYRRTMGFDEAISFADRLVRNSLAAVGDAAGAQVPLPRIRYRDLILEATGIDVLAAEASSCEGLRSAIANASLTLEVEAGVAGWRRSWLEALLDAHLDALQEPCWLTHYPAELALSARLDPSDSRLALRAELFFPGGMEVAHVYENLIGGALRPRYAERSRHRSACGLPPVPPNEGLMASAELLMPPMAGGALGIDRLLMLARGDEDVGHGLLFGREIEN
jgi:elongation factor P--(R)-beta-lysine ligase